jgi:hypothetical protein
MTLETLNGWRRIELDLSQLDLLRPLVDEAEATRLEALIVRGAAVPGQGELDLRMYILGTPEQAAIAVATILERIETDPDDHVANSDFHFMQMKLLGELAEVRGVDPADHAADLQSRRRAIPAGERTLAVPPPHEPSPPAEVLDQAALASPGWHDATTPCTAETWSLGDGRARNGVFEAVRTVPGGPGDWYLSIHQLGDERIDWVVLAQGGPAHVRSEGGEHRLVGEDAALEPQGFLSSRTGLLVWMGDAPEDSPSSVDHRMPNTPTDYALVWTYGVAVSPMPSGDLELYRGDKPDGGTVWAVHLPSE